MRRVSGGLKAQQFLALSLIALAAYLLFGEGIRQVSPAAALGRFGVFGV